MIVVFNLVFTSAMSEVSLGTLPLCYLGMPGPAFCASGDTSGQDIYRENFFLLSFALCFLSPGNKLFDLTRMFLERLKPPTRRTGRTLLSISNKPQCIQRNICMAKKAEEENLNTRSRTLKTFTP